MTAKERDHGRRTVWVAGQRVLTRRAFVYLWRRPEPSLLCGELGRMPCGEGLGLIGTLDDLRRGEG